MKNRSDFRFLVSEVVKNKILKAYFLGFLLFLNPVLGLSAVRAEEPERQKIVFGYIEFAPYYFTNQDGQPEGPLIELAKELAEDIGLEVEFLSMPTKRAVLAVASGEMELWFGLHTNPLYRDQILASEEPIMKLELRIYSKTPMDNFKGIEDLVGKSVVVMRGYSYGSLLEFLNNPENRIRMVRVSGHAQALKVLDTRDIDYLIDYSGLLNEGLEEYPIENLHSAVVQTLYPHITLHKDYPDAANVMHRLEEAFHKRQLADRVE